ncbi:MAG: hypothetical protein WAM30_06475 [Candidatus Dormiibacterota bacterium]
MSACRDSWAVVSWLDGEEPARTRVQSILPDAARRNRRLPVMSRLNAIEVYDRVEDLPAT